FRLTARDNRAGGGGVDYDTMSLNVASTAGPFLVTYPNANVLVGKNSPLEVTWDVANTDVDPVSCATVNLLLSTDGGLTFADTLAVQTPNDGSEVITIPDTESTT
ncbi:unnamed protein product, partial [marine sediment metagenome]